MGNGLHALAYDTPQGYRGLDCFGGKDLDLQVDTGKASATGVFAAASKDRGGDLLEIGGIQLENHKKNPIVLWLHAFDWKQADANMPIGTTEDPDGNYTVKLLPDKGVALATTFFSQSTLLAAQVTALVMEKTVRGQSIGYREIKVERMYEDDRYIGTKLVEVEMIETSWVPVPMNQDAVRSALSRDWAGKALVPSIKAALSPFASPAPAWANGFTLPTPEVKTMAQIPAAPANPASEVSVANAVGASQVLILPKIKAKGDDDTAEEEAEEKHGSKALRKIHKAAKAYSKSCRKAVAGLDDDSDISTMGLDHATAADEHAEACKELHGSRYKDSDPISDEEDEDEDDEDKPSDEGKDDEPSDEEKKALARLKRVEQRLKHELRLLDR